MAHRSIPPANETGRVAVYIDFDNIVISRYDQLFGRGSFSKDRAREATAGSAKEGAPQRLVDARVDVGAILDYASSFGTIVIARAYADWSQPVNAGYRRQLVDRAIDLTQLFNTAGTKNGADIRLAVDVVEDLFRLDDLTHIVIVAGDSDYIALAQRSKRLGRFVIAIGVAGATSRALVAAVDQFSDYDDLPGVTRPQPVEQKPVEEPTTADDVPVDETASPEKPVRGSRRASSAASKLTASEQSVDEEPGVRPMSADDAAGLLRRALELLDAKNDEEWQTNGEVKKQILRLNPSFKEKPLGFKTFSEFLLGHPDVVEIKPKSKADDRRLRLKS